MDYTRGGLFKKVLRIKHGVMFLIQSPQFENIDPGSSPDERISHRDGMGFAVLLKVFACKFSRLFVDIEDIQRFDEYIYLDFFPGPHAGIDFRHLNRRDKYITVRLKDGAFKPLLHVRGKLWGRCYLRCKTLDSTVRSR